MTTSVTGKERAIMYRFASETGLRRSEIIALTVDRFDLVADFHGGMRSPNHQRPWRWMALGRCRSS
jgi:hypothetical protein